MAAAKRKASKKAQKKAARKPQSGAKRPKAPKAPKAKPKAETPQDAAGKPTSGSQNPYRVGSSYWASVEALRALGVGRMHDKGEVVAAIRKALGDGWKAFAEKPQRNEATAKDAESRAWQNVAVLARKDYGAPLRAVGYEVRWNGREKAAGLFKIGNE